MRKSDYLVYITKNFMLRKQIRKNDVEIIPILLSRQLTNYLNAQILTRAFKGVISLILIYGIGLTVSL